MQGEERNFEKFLSSPCTPSFSQTLYKMKNRKHNKPSPGENAKFNKITEAAMDEARDILDGKIPAKQYLSAKELLDELDEEMDAEDRNADT